MKMLIGKLNVKNLLEEKRDYIGRQIIGIDIIITDVIYIVSLLCCEFKPVFGITADVVRIIAWVLAALILFYGLSKLIKSFRASKYDHKLLYKDIENLNEIAHQFSLVAIKDTFNKYPNRYLLYYEKSWGCWFFFNFRTKEQNNEKSIIEGLSNKLKIDQNKIEVSFICQKLQQKYSEKDKVDKLYLHYLYRGTINNMPKEIRGNEFEIEGIKYKWWTIDEMENDEIIMKKNSDVVGFVKDWIG